MKSTLEKIKQDYPQSLELHDVQRVRVYLSGAKNPTTYHTIAGEIEEFFGARGSSVQPQEGRWHRDIEVGAVIECCTDINHDLHIFATALRYMISDFGLTAYVTSERVTAVEVY